MYVAEAVCEAHAFVLVTVIVKVTADPASPAAAVYVGVVVPCPFVIVPAPFSIHAIVPLVELAPLTVAVLFGQIVWFPPATAVGNASTFTVYVARAVCEAHAFVLVTVIVKVTADPASPAAAVYVGVNEVEPKVIEPAPFSVQAIVPLLELAPLTVAVLFEQILWIPPAAAVGNASTIIVPVAYTVPQPPVKGILYPNEPLALGVPEIVIVLEAQVAETPAGKPLTPATPSFAIPVAPTVVCVIFVKTLFIHKVGVELAAVTVLTEITVTTKPALDGEAQTVPPDVIKAVAVYEADVETVLEAPDPRLD